MSAASFFATARGKTPQEAFRSAVASALDEGGHGRQSGTIAAKQTFVAIDLPNGELPYRYARRLIERGDHRVSSKHGPAGCIAVSPGRFLFFGRIPE